MSDFEVRLRRLEDEREILHTLYTYGHAIDYDLEEEFVDCWTQDAELYWSPTPFQGREQIRRTFRGHTHAPTVFHKHFLAEPRIRVEGDRATVESMFARLDAYPEGPEIIAYGRYRDILVRCEDGRWRFQERRAEVEAHRAPPEAVVAAARALGPT